MRRLLSLALLFALLYAVPSGAQLTHIRPGVSSGGVDLSGLTVPEAAAKLDAELGARLAPDLTIGVAGKPWVIKAAEAKLGSTRAHGQARALRQAGVTQVPPAISRLATGMKAFVAGIAKQVGKPAQDAKIKITLRHIYRQRSRPGRGLDIALPPRRSTPR